MAKLSRYPKKSILEGLPTTNCFMRPLPVSRKRYRTGLNYQLCQTAFKAAGLTIGCGTSGIITNCRVAGRDSVRFARVHPAVTAQKQRAENSPLSPGLRGGCKPWRKGCARQGRVQATTSSTRRRQGATCGPADSAKPS